MAATTGGQLPEDEQPTGRRRNVVEGLVRLFFQGNAVIQGLISYVETGSVPANVVLPAYGIPLALGQRQLIVPSEDGEILLRLESIERSRNPLLPFVREANVESRVLSELVVSGGQGEYIESVIVEPLLFFTFSSMISVTDNLRDYATFVRERVRRMLEAEQRLIWGSGLGADQKCAVQLRLEDVRGEVK